MHTWWVYPLDAFELFYAYRYPTQMWCVFHGVVGVIVFSALHLWFAMGRLEKVREMNGFYEFLVLHMRLEKMWLLWIRNA